MAARAAGMSLTGTQFDREAYMQQLQQSRGPGMYALGTPVGLRGVVGLTAGDQTDAESRLLGVGAGPAGHFPMGPGSGAGMRPATLRASRPEELERLQGEQTRLSNPPCSMRDSGVNRFDPICRDRWQGRALSPLDAMASDRAAAKAAHRPSAPVILDPSASLPPPVPDALPPLRIDPFPAVPMLPAGAPRPPTDLDSLGYLPV